MKIPHEKIHKDRTNGLHSETSKKYVVNRENFQLDYFKTFRLIKTQ